MEFRFHPMKFSTSFYCFPLTFKSMTSTRFKPLATALCAAFLLVAGLHAKSGAPNVLFIAVDDMNDWATLFSPNHPIRTPNLERLAERGVFFAHAYSASPACNPSRTAVLTGQRPTTSGVYANDSDWRAAMLPEVITLPHYFKNHGYRVEGTGKIFHHHGAVFHDEASFDDFRRLPIPADSPMPAEKLNGLRDYGSANTDWGIFPKDPNDHVDVQTTRDAIGRLHRLAKSEKPFFLAVGIFRPHMPFFAPASAFEDYPSDRVIMPPRNPADMKDIPAGWSQVTDNKQWLWEGMLESMQQDPLHYVDAVRAYQASSTFADQQIGHLIDALDETGEASNTIIVLWSDHGYHLGEKEHWEKFALWEKANHIPFIVVAPGVTTAGELCRRPVDLTVLYPTLVELAGLSPNLQVDGTSIVPLLKNPAAAWHQPAIMTYHRGNHAIRSERWRYIRYANGDEELYDHLVDPQEWNNLAGDPRVESVIDELAAWLPQAEAELVPSATGPLYR